MAAKLSGSDEDLYAMACHQAAFTVENSAHENYICLEEFCGHMFFLVIKIEN